MSRPGLVVAVDHGDDRLGHAEERARHTAVRLYPLLGAPEVLCTHPVRDGGAHYVASLAYPGGSGATAAVLAALGAPDAAVAVVDGDAQSGSGVPGGHDEHVLIAARDHAERRAGRAFSFPGQDRLRGVLPVEDVLTGSAIEALQILGGTPVDPAMVLQTREYVRPQYAEGRLILLARPAGPLELATFEVEFTHECCGGH